MCTASRVSSMCGAAGDFRSRGEFVWIASLQLARAKAVGERAQTVTLSFELTSWV
jgi:hypothetical protein